jgi:hypothetical protein
MLVIIAKQKHAIVLRVSHCDYTPRASKSAATSQLLVIHSSIHLAVCLTTGPKPLPKRTLHIVRSRASSFKWEYPLLSIGSSSSFLRLLPCLPVTSIPPCIFPSVTSCYSQSQKFRPFFTKPWSPLPRSGQHDIQHPTPTTRILKNVWKSQNFKSEPSK